MIRAILPDVGNVLSGFDPRRRERLLAEAYGTTMEVLRDFWDGNGEGGEPPIFKQVCLGTLGMEGLRLELAERLGKLIPAERFKELWLSGYTGPISGTIEFLRRIRAFYGLIVVACTDVDPWYAEILRGSGEPLCELFESEARSYEVGVLKPDPRMFRQALRLAGVPPEEAVFIDDQEDNAAGAAKLGIHAVHYQNTHQLAAELARFGIVL